MRCGLAGLVVAAFAWGRAPEVNAASVTLNPTSGPVGTVVTATGTGWIANEHLQVNWNSIIQTEFYEVLAETDADANGRFQVTFVIPQGAYNVIQDVRTQIRTNSLISIWFVTYPARSLRDMAVPFRMTLGPAPATSTPTVTLTPTAMVQANQPPECSIASPLGLLSGQLGELRSTSTDPDGTISSWSWFASGGSPLRGSAVSFQWSAPEGSFDITLTVTDNTGAASTCRVTMVVGVGAPPAPTPGAGPPTPGPASTPVPGEPVITIPPIEATIEPAVRIATWVSPAAGMQIDIVPGGGATLLSAQPDANRAAFITRVDFRGQWSEVVPAGSWATLCTATSRSADGAFACSNDFTSLPANDFRLAFDVYDGAGEVTYSPDGERRITRLVNLADALQMPLGGAATVSGFRPTDCEAGWGDHCGPEVFAADIVSDAGSVRPVAPGTVVFAGGTCDIPEIEWGPTCFGNTIILSHGQGIYSIYARLEGIAPWAGWPRAGYDTEIGIMGDSGCQDVCTPPTRHLHFSVRRGPESLTGEQVLWQAAEPVNIWELLPDLIAAASQP